MSVPREVTGGELGSLWRVANIALPTVENVYYEQAAKVRSVNDSPDEDGYGGCHPAWTTLARHLEQSLFATATSLDDTAGELRTAVDQYSRVAEDIDESLNRAGRELQEMLDSQGTRPVEAGPPGGYTGPSPDSSGGAR